MLNILYEQVKEGNTPPHRFN